MTTTNLADLARESYAHITSSDIDQKISENKAYWWLHKIKWGLLVFNAGHNLVSVILHAITMTLGDGGMGGMEAPARFVIAIAGILGLATIEVLIWATARLLISAECGGRQQEVVRAWLVIACVLSTTGIVGFLNHSFGAWYFKWVFPFSAVLMFAAALHIIFADHQVIAYRHNQEFKVESGLAVARAQHNRLMLSVEKQNDATDIQRFLYGRQSRHSWKQARKDKAGHQQGGRELYQTAREGLAEVKPLIALLEEGTKEEQGTSSNGREKKPARP